MQDCRKATETSQLAPASLRASGYQPLTSKVAQAAWQARGQYAGAGCEKLGAYKPLPSAQPATDSQPTRLCRSCPEIMTSSLPDLSRVEALIGRPEDDKRDLRSRDASRTEPLQSNQ